MKIGIIIGPEGGFDKEEVQMLNESGAKVITLGKRILRTETVGFTLLSIIMYEIGDLGGKNQSKFQKNESCKTLQKILKNSRKQ